MNSLLVSSPLRTAGLTLEAFGPTLLVNHLSCTSPGAWADTSGLPNQEIDWRESMIQQHRGLVHFINVETCSRLIPQTALELYYSAMPTVSSHFPPMRNQHPLKPFHLGDGLTWARRF